MKYKLNGSVRVEYTYIIDEEVEADSEADAIDAVCEDLHMHDAFEINTDVYALDIELIEEEGPHTISEAERMRQMGAPCLPGFELV